MEKTLEINNNNIRFQFIEHANCWQAKTTIDSIKLEIEIDFQFHKEREIDWSHFEGFYLFLNKENRLKDFSRCWYVGLATVLKHTNNTHHCCWSKTQQRLGKCS